MKEQWQTLKDKVGFPTECQAEEFGLNVGVITNSKARNDKTGAKRSKGKNTNNKMLGRFPPVFPQHF